MTDVEKRHLDVIAATVALLAAQIQAMSQASSDAPVAALPDACRVVGPDRCARVSEDNGTRMMGGVVVCGGCQERLSTPQ